jgi:hypothetical protein
VKTRVLLLIAVLCVLTAGCATKPKPPGPAEIAVTIRPGLLESLEKTRPKEVVVPVAIASKPEAWLNTLKKAIDIKGEAKDTQDKLQITDQSRFLEIRKVSNSAFYGDMEKLWRTEPSPDKTQFKVPDKETINKITFSMLKQFGFGEAEMNRLDVSTTDELFEITRPDKPATPIPVVVGKNVEVRRRINDLPVYGPGSKIKLYLSDADSVNGFMVTWRQFESSSSVLGHEPTREQKEGEKVMPINSKDAFTKLKADPLDHLPIALVDKIDIEDVKFGYYSRSAVEPQRYLQPVYVFSGSAHATLPNGKSVKVPYEQFIVALKKPMESIWPEQKTFKSESREKGMRPIEQDEDEVVKPR